MYILLVKIVFANSFKTLYINQLFVGVGNRVLAGLTAYSHLPHKAIQRVGRVPRLEATESRHPLLI